MKKGLSAAQLKAIAVIAMVIDHIAWGFVDFFSVPGQIMHVIGRLTLPIMCFFIAEGYRKTSNLEAYLYRMASFALISAVPFYLFFGEEYKYRQNIIFDLLLALMALSLIASKKIKTPVKILGTIALFALSGLIGGWPILPICYVLIFYYGGSFKRQALLMGGMTVLLEVCVISLILLNDRFRFMNYDWVWYQWLYFLGFALAIPLLYLYNGEKGKYPGGRYFFYMFYPCHFLVLYTIKCLMEGQYRNVYMLLHVVCLVFAVGLTIIFAVSRPSGTQSACLLVGVTASLYVFGFLIEIITSNVDVSYIGVIIEYAGECALLIAVMRFMAQVCRANVPKWIYLFSATFSAIILLLLLTNDQYHLFYTDVSMDLSGAFSRISLEYGAGFFFFIAFALLACGYTLLLGFRTFAKAHGIERNRIRMLMLAVAGPWAAYLLKLSGITGGYEISSVGVLFSIVMVYVSLVRYGYFDSVQLAGENALHQFGEGVLVVDMDYRILYVNKKMLSMFPSVQVNTSAAKYETIDRLVTKELKSFELDGKTYDASMVPLMEHGYIQGYMLCTRDMTEHYNHLREAERFAHTDSLTGLNNRSYYKELFLDYRREKGTGCMLMIDLDNFKGVNDTFGHSVGDRVLIVLAETLSEAAGDNHIACRIGGDEFCMFLKEITDRNDVDNFCTGLIADFRKRLARIDCEGATSISVGAAILDCPGSLPDEDDFKQVYKNADSALYEAKTSGKSVHRIYGIDAAEKEKK